MSSERHGMSRAEEKRVRRAARAMGVEYIFDEAEEAEEARILREASTNGLPGRVKLAKGIEDGIDPPEEFEPGILLKSRVHSIYAAGGIGKTWFVLWIVKRAIERGQKVLLLDAENGHRIISERLAALGVDTARLDELLHYYPFPNLTLDPEHGVAYKALLDAENYDLVVFDSLVNFLGSAGLEENSNDDIVKWATRYTRPARERGITTIVLDHVPHDGKHARGASRKRDEVDVMWELKNPIPFDRDTVGRIVLRREKDREGWLGERVGFSVGGTLDGFLFRQSEGTIEEPDEADGLTPSAHKALDVLRDDFGNAGAKAEQWRKATGQSTSTFYRSRDALRNAGAVEKRDKLYFPMPTRGDGSTESEEHPKDKPDSSLLPLLPKHSHGSNGSGAGGTPITPTTLKGGSDGSTALGGEDFAAPLHRQNSPQGTEEKEGSEVATDLNNLSSPAGGSAPGMAVQDHDVVELGVLDETERQICDLMKRGFSQSSARAEALAKDHPLDCECEVCV